MDEGGWFHAARVLPIQDVRSIGEDAVMIDTLDAVVSAQDVPGLSEVLSNKHALIGTPLMTTDGENLGTLADLYFDETTGRVTGYDMSGGVFADMATGRSFVPAADDLQLGKDVALVPPHVAAAMEEQEPGGLQKVVGTVSTSVQAAAGSVGDSVKELASNAAEVAQERQKAFVLGKTAARDVTTPQGVVVVREGETIGSGHVTLAEAHGQLGALTSAAGSGALQDAFSSARETVQTQLTPTAPVTVDDTLGRRVQQDVRSPGGSLIAAAGQIVTSPVIERAKLLSKEAALIHAVNLTVPVSQRLGQRGDQVRDGLSAGLQSVQETSSNLLERARNWASQTQERVSSDAEDRRIEQALGRPVNRVVLSRDDAIILNIGEIITHKAVEQARASDVLNILLTSVSTETPHIDPLASRPEEAGQAALPSQEEPARLGTQEKPT